MIMGSFCFLGGMFFVAYLIISQNKTIHYLKIVFLTLSYYLLATCLFPSYTLLCHPIICWCSFGEVTFVLHLGDTWDRYLLPVVTQHTHTHMDWNSQKTVTENLLLGIFVLFCYPFTKLCFFLGSSFNREIPITHFKH